MLQQTKERKSKNGSISTTAMHFPDICQQMGALVASEDSIYIVSHVDVTMDIANNRIEQNSDPQQKKHNMAYPPK